MQQAELLARRFESSPFEPARVVEIRKKLENLTNAGGHYRAASKTGAEYVVNVLLDDLAYLLEVLDER